MKWKNEPIIYLTRKIWQFSESKARVLLYIFFLTIATIIDLLEPLVIAQVFNLLQEQGFTAAVLRPVSGYLLLFFLLNILFWVFHGPARVWEMRNAFWVQYNYNKYLLEGIMQLPAKWHAEHHSGDTIDRMNKASSALYSYARDSFSVIETIVRFIGAYIALMIFNIHASYIVLILFVSAFTIIYFFEKKLIQQYQKLLRMGNYIAAKVFDTISNTTTIIILRMQKLVGSSLANIFRKPYSLYLQNNTLNEWKWFAVSTLSILLVVLVLGSFIYQQVLIGGTILVGTIYALYEYVNRINDLFFRFSARYSGLVQMRTAVLHGEEIAMEFTKRKRIRQFPLSKEWNILEMKNISFSYHSEGKELQLKNIFVAIKRGEKIALIGESGSGKTTFLKIIRGLYHPQQGEVSIDGHKLQKEFQSINDYISLIPQDPEIFSDTIKNNITLGIRHTLSYIKHYSNLAEFTRVAEKLPHGFNSSIHEKGVNLSGGQKQRLALARGLLASIDKEIILLDEPTSSIDVQTEKKIYRNIFSGFQEKTILSSLHRLHLLKLFDRIFLFDKGKIIAVGTFDELKEIPLFKALWEKYKEIT